MPKKKKKRDKKEKKPKAGLAYELFVYEKLKKLFPDAKVEHDDDIFGNESGFDRQIDVSMRLQDNGKEVLYIVQCRDKSRATDINVLGEFASVMNDVGAAKGFLLCSKGFAKSNRRYALTKGIELITIEDINSDRWNVSIEVPLTFIKKNYQFVLDLRLTATADLVEANKNAEINLPSGEDLQLTLDGGDTVIPFEEHMKSVIEHPSFKGTDGVPVDLLMPNLKVRIAGCWVPCTDLKVVIHIEKVRYLKYLKPTEYSQLTDHVRDTTIPLHAQFDFIPTQPDATFVKLTEADEFSKSVLALEIEEWTQFEERK